LTKSYGFVRAVRGISFEVAAGEVFALLGPNGAGKSTTVEILEGHRSADSGEVSVLGFDPARGGREFRDRIGIVLQESTVDTSEVTVAEALDTFGAAYRTPRDRDEVIALVGLEDKANARLKTLSGGQQRRIDMALGLIGDPDLIFLDEPAAVVAFIVAAAAFAGLGLGLAALAPSGNTAPAAAFHPAVPAPAWRGADLAILAAWGVGGALLAWRFFDRMPRVASGRRARQEA